MANEVYRIGSSSDTYWRDTAANTLTGAKRAASATYQKFVGGKIMVGRVYNVGTEQERCERVAVKHGYDGWQDY